MSFNDIDDTLVAYFKQMLEEESELQSSEKDSNSVSKETVVAESANQEKELTQESVGDPIEQELAEEPDIVQQSDDESLEAAESVALEDSQVNNEESVAENDDSTVEAASDLPLEEDYSEIDGESVKEDSDINDETLDAKVDESEELAPSADDVSGDELSVQSEDSADNIININDDTSQNNEESLSEDNSKDIDYASDDYVPEDNSDVNENTPVLQPQIQSQEEISEPLPFAEHKSLESLLESLPKTQLEIATQTDVETKTETVVQEEVAVEQVSVSESVVADETTVEAEQQESNDEAPYSWTNIEMPDEFQVLFFLVKGIRFAVPLVNLGGIFQCDKVTPLFGKPDWFQGIADIRGRKMNVVDTLKWVKSDAPTSDKYEYMISLDKTLWSIGCDVLEGNRILSKENITWRQTAGNRPWLAGIVKKEMCALLHVKALIKMFENGVNLKDLDAQMSA